MNRRSIAVLLIAAAGAGWLATGLERVEPAAEIAVVDCLGGTVVRRVRATRALAPAGACTLARYPIEARRIPLPNAEQARLPATDGGRWGLLGWATIRPDAERWRAVHAAGGSGGAAPLAAALAEVAPQLSIDRRGPERRVLGPTEDDRLRAALTEALDRRGSVLVELDVDSVDFLVARDVRRARPRDDARVMLIGLDGADWDVIDPLLADGRLPTLAALIERGARGRLRTISPMLSPVIWTSIATGVEPTRHGILDFLVEGPDGQPQPVTAAQRLVPALWERLSEFGVDVGVVGWWASWPAEPVRGTLVSDRLAYQLFGYRADPDDATGKTWPPELYERIRPLVVDPAAIDDGSVAALLGSEVDGAADTAGERELLDELRTLLASTRTYTDVALELGGESAPRFESVYLEGTDTIGHLFMRFRPPPLPGVSPRELARFGGAVDGYYELADRELARLLRGRDLDEWTVVIVSDHGFASDATRPRSSDSRIGHGAAAEWHRRFGVIVVAGAQARAGALVEEASIYDVAPTVLALFGLPVPRDWPGRVLADALAPGFVERWPVRLDPRPTGTRRVAGGGGGIDDPNAAELMAKLESLGYVSAGGAGAATTAVNNAAVALMGQGRLDEAEAEFRRGLADQPGSTMLELNLALCLVLQGRGEEAAAGFERVLGRDTDGPAGRVAAVQLARIRAEAGEPDAARGLLERALAIEPDAIDALTLAGELAEAGGRADEAERLWRRAATLDASAAAARNHLGTLVRARGELDEAERHYREAIEADPYLMGAYNNLALIYQASGRIEQAIDLYRRALVKAPEHATVLNNLASLRYQQGRVDRAIELWRRAAAADPDYPSPLSNLAGMAIQAGRHDEAEQLLDRALALDPGFADAWYNRALLELARGDRDAAREALRAAARDRSSAPRALFELGALELQDDRPAEAARALAALVELVPDHVEGLNSLGEALRRTGRPERAAAVWRRSLELRPDQPAVRRRLALLDQVRM